jgi:hypothetical protein
MRCEITTMTLIIATRRVMISIYHIALVSGARSLSLNGWLSGSMAEACGDLALPTEKSLKSGYGCSNEQYTILQPPRTSSAAAPLRIRPSIEPDLHDLQVRGRTSPDRQEHCQCFQHGLFIPLVPVLL